MAKFLATVSIDVCVEIDEAKFTEAFMAEFRQSFYPFTTVEHHVRHLAQLEARGLLDLVTEGYGEISDFGIKARELGFEVEDLRREGAR